MAAIDGIKQINTELVTGTKSVSSNNTVMTSANLNRTNEESYSTSNAGTEELDKNEKVDINYVKATLAKLFQGKNLKYKDKNGQIKALDINDVLTKLGENKKFSLDNLQNMTKEQFNNIILCLKAAIEDSVDANGVIDTIKAFKYFTAYNVAAIKAGDSKLSAQENIEKTRKELKEAEKTSIQEKLKLIDLDNREDLIDALKEYLNVGDLQKRLSEAKTEEEKKAIINGEVREIVKLLHGASAKDMMKVGFALLQVVKDAGLVDVLDTVADMLIPDGMRKQFIDLINKNKDILINQCNFSENQIKELCAYLANNDTYDGNKVSLDSINATLQQLQPVFEKIEDMWKDYQAACEKEGKTATKEEFYQYLRDQGKASEQEISDHQTYIQKKAELEGFTAGFIGNENLNPDQTKDLISQAYGIAEKYGFGEEFLKGVNEYIKEHGKDYELSEQEINNILNEATNNQYGEVTGEGTEAQPETTEVVFGVTEEVAGGLNPTEEVTQAQENAQAIKDQIATQTNAAKETPAAEVKPVVATGSSTNFFSVATDKALEVKDNTVKHYANIEQAVKENTKAKFSEIKKMTGEATGVLVEYIFTTQNIGDNLLNGAKTRFDSLLSCVKQNIASSGNLTREAVAVIEKDNSTKQFLADRYRKNDEKQQMGV